MKAILDKVRKTFTTGKTKSYEYRVQQLNNLKSFLVKEEAAINAALKADLHRSNFEATVVEVSVLTSEIDHFLRNLKDWMQPTYTNCPVLFAPASSEIIYEPYGVALILGAFNYPVTLTLSPLIGAIAAGNVAVIKPSEMAVQVEKVLSELLPKYLDPEAFVIVCGGIQETSELLSLRWDKIFFTGSTRVGKIVAKAAAEHLTPVSLELGGKSPTIIHESVVDLELVTQRIIWGKCVNAGQTCIAPDYIFVHTKHYQKFLEIAKSKIKQFYGENVKASDDLCRIISDVHFDRLNGLLNDAKDNIYCGGNVDKSEKFIEPTLLIDLDKSKAKVMQEEIFGPLLPVFPYSDINEVIEYVNSGGKPLTMYIFGKERKAIDNLIERIPSGSVLVNDTLFQFANIYAPFGGVGDSGLGGYHGKFSFECFSHRRPILRRDDHRILDVPLRYPPYTKFGENFLKFAAKLPDLPPIQKLPQFFIGLFFVAAIGYVAITKDTFF